MAVVARSSDALQPARQIDRHWRQLEYEVLVGSFHLFGLHYIPIDRINPDGVELARAGLNEQRVGQFVSTLVIGEVMSIKHCKLAIRKSVETHIVMLGVPYRHRTQINR